MYTVELSAEKNFKSSAQELRIRTYLFIFLLFAFPEFGLSEAFVNREMYVLSDRHATPSRQDTEFRIILSAHGCCYPLFCFRFIGCRFRTEQFIELYFRAVLLNESLRFIP